MPGDGPVILAARHYHHLLDGVGLIKHLRRPLHILVALDWVSRRATRSVMEALTAWAGWPVTLRTEELRARACGPSGADGCAYDPDEAFAYQRRAYQDCIEILREGRVLVVFPEGYPVVDPHATRAPRETVLAPFKPGFARLAITASRAIGRPVHVLPVGIRVTDEPPGGLTFVFGEGYDVTEASDVETLTRTTYQAVLDLST